MSKFDLTKPTLVMLYGYPGAGKTYFARQLSDTINAAHISSDRIRSELFETPRYDKQEDSIIDHLMQYMAEEYLRAGLSVIYDINAMRLSQRKTLRELAQKSHAQHLLVWLQIDQATASTRLNSRDRRKSDDKYSAPFDKDVFEKQASHMQNPQHEDYVVISGKHTFNTQRSAVIKKLYDQGLLDANTATSKVIKPGLVNLIPNPAAGRVDLSRRNIIIR